MKIRNILAAIGVATAAVTPIAGQAQAQRLVVSVGAPAGPGWYGYRDRVYRSGWDGPRYWDRAGPHRGYYAWNGGYYQNCSYRWKGRHHRAREWRCW